MRGTAKLTFVGFLAVLLAACGGGGGGSTPAPPAPPANVAPIANAGAAQSVSAGATVTLNGTASSDSDGSIASYAWTQTAGTAVTLTNPTSSQPTFTAPQVGATSTLTFSLVVTDNRGTASGAAAVTITVSQPGPGNGTISGVVRFERVPFRTTSPFGLNYANTTLQPARQITVRAIDATTAAVLATSVTDAGGAYTLSVAANTLINVQAVARMQSLPRWDVRVQDGIAAASPYAFTSTAINSNSGTFNVDIPTDIGPTGVPLSLARSSGPFAILDTIYVAMQAVLAVAPAVNFPELYVDWGAQTEGTFYTTANGQHIALMKDITEDTDEFDRHVIAHEFGHYIERNFSRSDSIGGDHGLGDRLDPRVAFGEGFASAFAAIVLNDPVFRDSFINGGGNHVGGGFQIENNPATVPPTTGSDGLGCWCSESSVWSIIYDLSDSAADANDTLAMGLGPIWDVMTSAQRTTPAVTSIFSFITALKAARPGDVTAINALVAAQNIDAINIDAFATTETHEPFSNILPLYTNIAVGAPVVVRTIDDGGRHNRAGNRRLLRFVPATSASVVVSLTTSNPNATPDPDFRVLRAGTLVALADDPPAQPQTDTFSAVSGTTYVIDAYDCANGCSTDQGTPGDYDLTVTIN